MKQKTRSEPLQVHGITGLEESVFYLVVEEVAIHLEYRWETTSGRRRSLDLPAAVAITVAYLRHNLTQGFLASMFNVHQATISRTISTLTPLIATALTPFIPTDEEARTTAHDTVVLIDGTLCPTWSWRGKKKMYNGKHHRTGHTLTVISTLEGHTVYISDSSPGATHDKTDSTRPDVTSILESAHTTIGDKGYQGTPCLTPYKNYRNQPLTTAQQEVNSQINKLRAPIERAIVQLKTWRILHTNYRRPLHTWNNTLQAIKALHFLKQTTNRIA